METPATNASRLLAMAEYAAEVQPREFWLEADTCTLGRALTCQVVVQRRLVSRLHAQITRVGLRYLLSDLGSANGTFVNGRRLSEPQLLADGDQIGLGAPAGLLTFMDADATFVPQEQLRYEERTMRFFVGQAPVELSPALFRLLRHLYEHSGEVCTRERCAEAVWGAGYEPGNEMNPLDRLITQLRGQLRLVAPEADFLRTRRGLGYELVPWTPPGES